MDRDAVGDNIANLYSKCRTITLYAIGEDRADAVRASDGGLDNVKATRRTWEANRCRIVDAAFAVGVAWRCIGAVIGQVSDVDI